MTISPKAINQWNRRTHRGRAAVSWGCNKAFELRAGIGVVTVEPRLVAKSFGVIIAEKLTWSLTPLQARGSAVAKFFSSVAAVLDWCTIELMWNADAKTCVTGAQTSVPEYRQRGNSICWGCETTNSDISFYFSLGKKKARQFRAFGESMLQRSEYKTSYNLYYVK